MLEIPICTDCHGRSVHTVQGHGCGTCKGGGLICPPIPKRMAFSSGFPNVAGLGRGAHTTDEVAPGISIPGTNRKVEGREHEREGLNQLLISELEHAGIEWVAHGSVPERTEVFTNITGSLGTWKFTRAWRYWVATSPEGLRITLAESLHYYLGRSARANGDAACRGPQVSSESSRTQGYHLDSQDGLNALASTIRKQLHKEWAAEEKVRMDSIQAARDQLRERSPDSFPPIHPQECDKCVYLGSFITNKDLKGEPSAVEWRDYYHCPNASTSEGGSILARWGKDGQYSSFDVPTVAKMDSPKPGTWLWHGQRLIKEHGIPVVS